MKLISMKMSICVSEMHKIYELSLLLFRGIVIRSRAIREERQKLVWTALV